MSLRGRITLLSVLTVVAVTVAGAIAGERIAARALERSVREHALDVAESVAAALDLGAIANADAAADALDVALQRHRGVHRAELILPRGGGLEAVAIEFGPDGVATTTGPATRPLPSAPAVSLVEDARGRSWAVDWPLRALPGQGRGALRIEASLAEVVAIAAQERRVFLAVACLGATTAAIAFSVALRRMLVQPLSRLAEALERVESGALDQADVPGKDRRDEIGTVARGLDAMLQRLRRFSAELEAAVDDAVADLAAKNRELAHVNDQLVEARRTLTARERLAALGQLSGTIAHELGNPLNTISGHVQLVARDPACPPPLRAQLLTVESEVQRMTAIIRRFLDSARALVPEPTAVRMAELLDEALALSVSVEARARLEVHREVDGGLDRARLDPTLVRHVLTNLISNAVDAMPDGGRLGVRAWRAGEQLAIAVSDTGAGLSPEQRRRVFEPFFTSKPRGKGSGLGLAICRELANALKGRVDVASEPGAGATFTLWLPAPPA